MNGVVKGVAVGHPQDEEVNVANGTDAPLTGVPGCPRAENVCVVDSVDRADGVTEHGGHAERLRQDVGQPVVVRALDVRRHQARPSYSPAQHQASGLGTLNFSVDRRVRNAGQLGEIREAEL